MSATASFCPSHCYDCATQNSVNISYLPPGNVRLSDPQHVDRCLVQSEERSIVDLTQTEQLHHLARLWVDPVDTAIQKKHSHNRRWSCLTPTEFIQELFLGKTAVFKNISTRHLSWNLQWQQGISIIYANVNLQRKIKQARFKYNQDGCHRKWGRVSTN